MAYYHLEEYSITRGINCKEHMFFKQNCPHYFAIKTACEEFYIGGDKYYSEWKNVDIYIADFYEWEIGANAWLCKNDGSYRAFPVQFEETNDGFKVQSIKWYTIKNKEEFNEFGRFQFERDINDAVRHFKCNTK